MKIKYYLIVENMAFFTDKLNFDISTLDDTMKKI